jgi:hypothetical protein
MSDTYELITMLFGAPPALLGLKEIGSLIWIAWDDSQKAYMLRKNPVGDDQEHRFYVKTTHAKYIMGEDSSELTKIRVIIALKDVNNIRIDRVPNYIDPAGKERPLKQECFSIPGVAIKKPKYYQVDLAKDQIFKAKGDYTYITSIKLLQKLGDIHDKAWRYT